MNIITQITADTISAAQCWHKQTQHYLQQIYSNACSYVWKKKNQNMKVHNTEHLRYTWHIPLSKAKMYNSFILWRTKLEVDWRDIAQWIRWSATRHLWSIFHNSSSTILLQDAAMTEYSCGSLAKKRTTIIPARWTCWLLWRQGKDDTLSHKRQPRDQQFMCFIQLLFSG